MCSMTGWEWYRPGWWENCTWRDPVWRGDEEKVKAGLEIAHRTLRPLIVR